MIQRALAALLVLLVAAAPVWAQPQQGAPQPGRSWLGVVVACVLGVCVVLASIMSAKRGHRD